MPQDSTAKVSVRARRLARRFVLQALYQRQLAGTAVREIEAQFLQDHEHEKFDQVYFHEVLTSIPAAESELCDQLAPVLDRRLEELDPIELAILLMGCYELAHRVDVPYKVVINEAIELAKVFGAAESHKYVNSVLDKMARRFREAETGSVAD